MDSQCVLPVNEQDSGPSNPFPSRQNLASYKRRLCSLFNFAVRFQALCRHVISPSLAQLRPHVVVAKLSCGKVGVISAHCV